MSSVAEFIVGERPLRLTHTTISMMYEPRSKWILLSPPRFLDAGRFCFSSLSMKENSCGGIGDFWFLRKPLQILSGCGLEHVVGVEISFAREEYELRIVEQSGSKVVLVFAKLQV